MTQIWMPYGNTGLWFVRMPCYLRASAMGHQLRMEVVSCLTGKPVRLAVHAENAMAAQEMFEFITSSYESRHLPHMRGIDQRTGTHSVVVYGVKMAVLNGEDVIDIHVQGGSIRIEPG